MVLVVLFGFGRADAGAGNVYTGVGTNTKYYIFYGGTYNDITPIVHTSTLTSVLVRLLLQVEALQLRLLMLPIIQVLVTLLLLLRLPQLMAFSSQWRLSSCFSAIKHYITVTFASNASGTGSGTGGTVTLNYEYPSGLDVFSIGTGWGAGPYSRGTWGSGYSSGIGQQLRLWSNDNYGADLVIAPRGGPIFYWQDSLGVGTRAQSISSLANATTALTDNATFTTGVTSITVSSGNAPYIYPYMVITGANIPAGTKVASTYITGSTTVPITTTTTGASSGKYNFSYAGAFVPAILTKLLLQLFKSLL